MKLGFIRRINLELNPHLTERFKFTEFAGTRKITSNSDRIYSKMFYPLDYEEVDFNTKMLKGNSKIILVDEPFFLDDDLRERVVRWVEWANHADPKEYDMFA
jgi:hypothetical protein